MTCEQAKSELMQIYGSLSEKMKQALDVLMAQADGDLISKDAVIEWLKDIDMIKTSGQEKNAREQLTKLPSVAIPSAEPCEDAISRQEAIEAAMQDVNDRRTHGFNAGATRAANRIKLLPPVTPQPKIGHWIVHEHAEEFYGRVVDNYECDNCGDWYLNKTNFCPNCGCRMVEPQERSE